MRFTSEYSCATLRQTILSVGYWIHFACRQLLARWQRVDWRNLSRDRRIQFFAFLFAIPVFGAVAAYSVAPAEDEPLLGLPPSQIQSLPLELPVLAVSEDLRARRAPSANPTFVQEETIRRGDTLASLFWRLGIQDSPAEAFIRRDSLARQLLQLRPGHTVQAHTDAGGHLQVLRYVHPPITNEGKNDSLGANLGAFSRVLLIEKTPENDWRARTVEMQNEQRIEMRQAEIRSSLFAATDAANIPDGIATQIAELFSGEIDFHTDLRRGDRLRVIYETYYQQGDFVRAGRVLAAEFTNAGVTHQAFWFGENRVGQASSSNQVGSYYTAAGKSMKRAFLRSPLEFSRVTSGFTQARFHPVLQTWRAHRGVDYGAPIGTPIRATADGVVDVAGVQGGYGKVVILKHASQYTTVYGHLNAFGRHVRKGSKVHQGEIIGYVGQTGWATGPHLHYEFRVRDEPRNPLTIALPQSLPLPGARMLHFLAYARGMQQHLQRLQHSTVALLE